MINLFRSIFLLINQERVVLYPAMIFAFIGAWLTKLILKDEKALLGLGLYLLISWLLNLFIQLLTADIGHNVLQTKPLDFNTSLLKTVIRFIPAIFWTGSLATLIGLFILSGQKHILLGLAVMPFLIIFSVALQIYPVIYVVSGRKAPAILILLWDLLTKQLKTFLQIFLFLIFTSLTFILTAAIFETFPPQVNSVLIPLLQGLFNVIICYAILLFWLEHKSKIKVSV